MLLEAVVATGALWASAFAFGVSFGGPYIILALLVFSLTFPGQAPRGTSAPAIAREVLVGWLLIVGLLLMLGWATRTIEVFDERVIITWVAVTPVAMFAAHMLTPWLLPKILAAEGVKRTAVIAGASGLGRKLAERIRATPYLGVEVTGFFDDRSTGRLRGLDVSELLGSVDELAAYAKKHRVEI